MHSVPNPTETIAKAISVASVKTINVLIKIIAFQRLTFPKQTIEIVIANGDVKEQNVEAHPY